MCENYVATVEGIRSCTAK